MQLSLKTIPRFRAHHVVSVFVILTTLSVGCTTDQTLMHKNSNANAKTDQPNHPHWGYRGIDGPRHWGLLTKEYAACETGGKQSPINIQTKDLEHH